MGIPAAQMATVGGYVLKQRLLGRERYPLVLMLEPLFRALPLQPIVHRLR
jgi:hypothetical protein